MVEPGLSQRLRRHSRNSGMMIGVSMAAAMIICIAAFIWFYVQIGPLLSDFIPQDTAGDDPAPTTGLIGAADDTDDVAVDDFTLDEIEPEPAGTPEATEDEEENAVDDEGNDVANEEDDDIAALVEEDFEPTHEIREGPNVNFRSGPNTISEPQGSLPPGTPLMFLGEEEPSGGVAWLYLQTEDGTEGWIRDIDLIEYETVDADFNGEDDE